jgi:histidyl-tRNA synthetase
MNAQAEVFVTVFDEECQPVSLAIASELRKAGMNVICNPEVAKLPRQFKYADRIGVRLAVVIGPDEMVNNQVTIKDLRDSSQQTVSRVQATEAIKKLLESHRPM